MTPPKPGSENWRDTKYHKLNDDYDKILPTGRKPLPDGMVLDEIPEGMHARHPGETREEADARGAREHPELLEARQAAARRRAADHTES